MVKDFGKRISIGSQLEQSSETHPTKYMSAIRNEYGNMESDIAMSVY